MQTSVPFGVAASRKWVRPPGDMRALLYIAFLFPLPLIFPKKCQRLVTSPIDAPHVFLVSFESTKRVKSGHHDPPLRDMILSTRGNRLTV